MTVFDADVVVVGGGIGGLCASVWLGAAGLRVHLLERHDRLGGKAAVLVHDGVEIDTGPSVLTLPEVFEDVFERAALPTNERITLTTPEPAFRYLYPDGVSLDIHHDVSRSLESVRQTLGSRAGDEFETYLRHTRAIWEVAAPHFVFGPAPSALQLMKGGPRRWAELARIDAFRSLESSINAQVTSPHLRSLFARYATYNGSDATVAPATLGCIAHVELSLGGFGVQGGMFELVRALERAARRVGVHLHVGTSVERLLLGRGSSQEREIRGVLLQSGETIVTEQVICNTDAAHLVGPLLSGDDTPRDYREPAMSAHCGIVRASRKARAAHTVVFPRNYLEEFKDIFDRKRVPIEPTVYVCAQEVAHGRAGWSDSEPLFCMINAPALTTGSSPGDPREVSQGMLSVMNARGLIEAKDPLVWWRTPADLSSRFPGSQGSLYGAASNSMMAAFRRPANRVPRVRGVYLASGTAHPGGGVPLVALSGKQAALLALQDRSRAA